MAEWNIDKLLLFPDKAIKELNDNRKRLKYIKRRVFEESDRPIFRIEDIQMELEHYED